MDKKILLWITVFLLCFSFVSADLSDDVISYWSFDDGNFSDQTGQGSTFSDSGTTQVEGILGNARYFDGSSDYMSAPDNDLYDDFNDAITINLWINSTESTRTGLFFMADNDGPADSGPFIMETRNDLTLRTTFGIDGGLVGGTQTTLTNWTTGAWTMITYKWSDADDKVSVYQNGYNVQNITASGTSLNNLGSVIFLGCLADNDACVTPPTFNYDGRIDEVGLWNRSLSPLEIQELWNDGIGLAYPFTGGGGGENPAALDTNYTAVNPELENSTSLFTFSLNWTKYNVTNSSVLLTYNNSEYLATLVESLYGVNGSLNYTVIVPTPFVVLNNTNVSYSWKYNITYNHTVFTNATTTEEYQFLLWNYPRINITRVYNSYANTTLFNFSGNLSKGSYNLNFDTIGSSYLLVVLNGTGNYTVFVDKDGYAVNNETNYRYVYINDTSNLSIREVQFGLYSSNSVLVNVFEEASGDPITGNVSLTVIGNESELDYNFSGGSYLVENLTDGSYQFEFSALDYEDRTYVVTVADNSFQVLNAFLSNSTDTVTFVFVDYDATGTSLEGVSISMSKFINGSYAVVESHLSDITGRAQFTYDIGENYRFLATLSGYQPKQFDLNPILFSTYTVKLQKVLTANDTTDYSQVSVYFTPKAFYDGRINNVSMYFLSPTGSFEAYNATFTWPGGSQSVSGTSSQGEVFDLALNITGSSRYDTVNVTYAYKASTGPLKTFSFEYEIVLSSGTFGTALANVDNTYGLSLLDRIIIVVLSTLIVAGVAFFFGGLVSSALMALLMLGYFAHIQIVPLWSIILSIIVLFISITWGSTR